MIERTHLRALQLAEEKQRKAKEQTDWQQVDAASRQVAAYARLEQARRDIFGELKVSDIDEPPIEPEVPRQKTIEECMQEIFIEPVAIRTGEDVTQEQATLLFETVRQAVDSWDFNVQIGSVARALDLTVVQIRYWVERFLEKNIKLESQGEADRVAAFNKNSIAMLAAVKGLQPLIKAQDKVSTAIDIISVGFSAKKVEDQQK